MGILFRTIHVMKYLMLSILSNEFACLYSYIISGKLWQIFIWAVFYGIINYNNCLWGYCWEESMGRSNHFVN